MPTSFNVYAGGGDTVYELDKSTGGQNNSVATSNFTHGINAEPDKEFYLGYNGAPHKYDSTLTKQWTGPATDMDPYDVEPTPSGYVYAADQTYLYKLNSSDGTVVWKSAHNHAEYIRALTVGHSGDIFISGGASGDVSKFDSTGTQIWTKNLSSTYLRGMVEDTNGNFYTGDNNGIVTKYDSTYTQVWQYSTKYPFSSVAGEAPMFPDGSFVMGGTDGMARINPDGSTQWEYSKSGVQFKNTHGHDTDGNVYLSDGKNNDVYKLDSTGAVVWTNSFTDIDSVSAHPNYQTYPGEWSTTAKVTATKVSASGGMHSGSLTEFATATKPGASAGMHSAVPGEFATATKVGASSGMHAATPGEFATASKVGASAGMATGSLTEFATATKPSASAGMHSPTTLDMLTASKVGASAGMHDGLLVESLSATKAGVSAGMHAPTTLDMLTATKAGVSAGMHDGLLVESLSATKAGVSAGMHAATPGEFITATKVGATATAHNGKVITPNLMRLGLSNSAGTSATGNDVGVSATDNRAQVTETDNEVN